MSVFQVRTRGYQVGLILLYAASILFVIGIVSPMWLVYESEVINIREERYFAGVLIGCRYNLRKVGADPFAYTRCSFGFSSAFDQVRELGDGDGIGGWIHAVETFEIISAIALIFACIYAALVNCFTRYPSGRSRILEIVTFAGGLTAFIFSMVFVGQLRAEVEKTVFLTFTWAFYLSVVASIMAMVAALIIALFNEYIPAPSDFSKTDFNYTNVMVARQGPSSEMGYSVHSESVYNTRMSRAGSQSIHNESFDPRASRGGGGGRDAEEFDPRIMQGENRAREGENRARGEEEEDYEDRFEPRTRSKRGGQGRRENGTGPDKFESNI